MRYRIWPSQRCTVESESRIDASIHWLAMGEEVDRVLLAARNTCKPIKRHAIELHLALLDVMPLIEELKLLQHG
ncbi:hypothetical protein GJ744_008514 [Endocarpon pusillum]|uniref:Uncharacterized protein n=1 Tax=Endocarpon pusillum TaxID=364733 RepID=A0A8H7AH65_9EURO|nr:hypothetical protein GJ744_008514 [Endocarpon pusillum]